MKRASEKLKKFSGENPFHEAQAKNYPDDKIIQQFYPVSLYWSLFNEQHEILLGTRGSGKTILLKMLSFSFLSRFSHKKAQEHKKTKRFLGFYLPLHLEFVASLPGKKYPDEKKLEFFQFACNCSAAKALLEILRKLVDESQPTPQKRLGAERLVLEHLVEMWFKGNSSGLFSLADLQWKIEVCYQNQPFWLDGEEHHVELPFDCELFRPLIAVMPQIAKDLGLDPANTTWVACLDEAEFLKEPFWICINSFMRSEKRPLVLKVATLPFKYPTRKTLVEGVSVEPNGNDFNFRVVDLQPDSPDFAHLTNYILSERLARCRVGFEKTTLEEFLGVLENDDSIDYYREELSKGTSSPPKEEDILKEIVASLSIARKQRYETIKAQPQRVESDYFRRFSPVYYVRRMRQLDSEGNRSVGWFAGAKTFRKVADGNPRRFIQLMHDCVELARERELTPMNQHRVLVDFAKRQFGYAEGLPDFGLLLKVILDSTGKLLEKRVHDAPNMVDGGCYFTIDKQLIEHEAILQAVQLGIQYSYLFCDNEDSMFEGLCENSLLRLAYLCAVHFWLPMRKGEPILLRSKKKEELFSTVLFKQPRTASESLQVVKQLQLELGDSEANEANQLEKS